ncbi:TNFAIP3-interacting protein 3 [Bufo gargarizans]|uniref:TNFAIP3-interacting protein 3 n=1 Tax=Bufo gargarizans TaxID=30331 RepID=UPI001CF14CD8|nr:TNFAIP3-interacting protein 3 [Bufo gargarizans]
MEDKTPLYGEEDACEITELKLYWNKCLESERCDGMELNPVIRQQIRQSVAPQDEKQSLPFPRQQLLNQSTLRSHRHLLQTKKSNSVSKEEYEHTIQILEKQQTELLKVNKQWDHYCRYIKESYENKSKEEFSLELHKIKEENYILKRQNHVLRKQNDNYESEVQRLNLWDEKLFLRRNAASHGGVLEGKARTQRCHKEIKHRHRHMTEAGKLFWVLLQGAV